jgi:hypothetical protein
VVKRLSQRIRAAVSGWQPEAGDAVLYAASALFAIVTFELSGRSLYRQWGELAVGPYLAVAVASAVVGQYRRHRVPVASRRQWSGPRIALFLVALFGATLVPLSLEVAWRSEGNAAIHVQPEVAVIEHAGQRAAAGKNPYQASVRNHTVTAAVPGEPAWEAFFPYLPLMTVFGMPSSLHAPIRLTDARIAFSGVTLLVVAAAIALARAPNERKIRTLQFLTVLPSAALPLATGGDDMPIVAFLLLAMVLAQRRRPLASGIVLGIVASMKFTAWPLAALALFAARGRDGKRAPGWMLAGMVLVAGPVVTPFVFENAHTFVVNVILFPLGLSGVTSPAASPLPGHLLVSAIPALHRALPLALAAGGGAVVLWRLVRRTPSTAAEVCSLAGWIMLGAILFAPATRIGYLLYPLNFFIWASMLRGAEDVTMLEAMLARPIQPADTLQERERRLARLSRRLPDHLVRGRSRAVRPPGLLTWRREPAGAGG